MLDPFDALLAGNDDVGEAGAAPRWPWLDESWSSPEGFFAALLAQSPQRLGTATKSQYNLGYDFYYDAVLRHLPLGGRRVALRWYEPDHGWQTRTLAALHARATELASQLRAHEIGPEVTVALVLPVGEALVATLLAVLRLGACVALVPPVGATAVQSALKAAKPKVVISARPYTALRGLPLWKPILLDDLAAGRAQPVPPVAPAESPASVDPALPGRPDVVAQGQPVPPVPPVQIQPPRLGDGTSATFPPDMPAFSIRSPLCEPEDKPVLLPSAAAYHHALRDGLLVYGLSPGDALAVPTAPLLQRQPATLLAALLCGAELTLLDPEGVKREPAVLTRAPLRAVVLDAALRDALLASGTREKVRWTRWFTNPEEPHNPPAWEQLSQRLQLGNVPRGHLFVDPGTGGVTLFSVPGRGPLPPQVVPTPGCAFDLLEPGTQDLPALGSAGTLSVRLGKELRIPALIALGKNRRTFLYGGAVLPRRVACAYPAADARALVEALPGVVGAAVVPVANAELPTLALFSIVVFTGVQTVPGLSEQIFDVLDAELGPDGRPDRVEIFPLFPRLGEEGVDLPWVRSQYLTGTLLRKSRSRALQLLTQLRAALMPPEAAGPAAAAEQKESNAKP